MSERTFESPVFVRAAEGLIQEIACLEDAFDFLNEWPKHRRGVIYERQSARVTAPTTVSYR